MLINKKYLNKKKKFLNHLTKNGIENRPILSGNFTNQPATKLYNLNKKNYLMLMLKKLKILVFLLVYTHKKYLIKLLNILQKIF